jgi:hypothetical protein
MIAARIKNQIFTKILLLENSKSLRLHKEFAQKLFVKSWSIEPLMKQCNSKFH